MSDIACLGIMVADAIGRPIDTIPEKARLQLFDQMELHTGGCAINTGIAMAKLGNDVTVIGKVGADGFGDFIVNEIEKSGASAAGVVRAADTSTAFTFIMVSSDGERRFLHTMGANATFDIDDVDMAIVAQSKMLHVAGSYLMSTFDGEQTTEVLRRAKEADVTTSLDTAYNDRTEDWLGMMKPSLPYLDIFVPSIEEAEQISGCDTAEDMALFFRDNGVKIAGVKMGREGCYVLSDDGEVRFPIYEVETIDSSGAGDSWYAGFLTGLLKGWCVERAAKFGNATAAHCVQAIGCTAGVKSFDEILAFQEARG